MLAYCSPNGAGQYTYHYIFCGLRVVIRDHTLYINIEVNTVKQVLAYILAQKCKYVHTYKRPST